MMTSRATASLLALLAFFSVIASSAGQPLSPELISNIKPPAAFAFRQAKKLTRQYPGTTCLDFTLTKSKRKIGYLCSTQSEKFLRDFGVFSVPQGTSNWEFSQRREVSIASGISSYPAARLELKSGATIYAAEVDCDLKGGSVYRPTGTCHVAVRYLRHGGVLYGNFVLEDHASKAKVATKEEIIALWESLPNID
ncbi:hypothetical protein VSR17_26045 [Cupriavidus taiwanensis]|uniref:hypothetical protein n=1 Tax=Cupriavidus taiwanensis TaxID=164546 RepID=UPI000E190220|nr:hypothetical protein [Cupriavidus taiwanensis]SOZ24296.1 conserved exported hypothetical protein [Cupriavidus taiwanensis]SPA28755.1 conserved exported hypothetical protein [Cupriavidus taiwanensis]